MKNERIVKLLGFLKNGNLNFWQLVPHMDYLPEFVSLLKNLEKQEFIKTKRSKIILTDKGKRLARKLKVKKTILPLIKDSVKSKALLKKFINLPQKEDYLASFDQLPLSPQTIVRKIEFMESKNDLQSKRVICIGDDDFVALALMLTKLPEKLAVIDIDPELLKYEKKIAKKFNYKIDFQQHNLVNPIPSKIKGKYDVFISEPPDTIEGHKLFTSRAVECLKKSGGVGYIGITKASLSSQQRNKVQENILKMGGVLTDAISNFEVYKNIGDEFEWISGLPEEISLPNKPWFLADLWRIEFFNPKPLIKGKFNTPFIEEVLKTEFKF